MRVRCYLGKLRQKLASLMKYRERLGKWELYVLQAVYRVTLTRYAYVRTRVLFKLRRSYFSENVRKRLLSRIGIERRGRVEAKSAIDAID